MSRLPAIWQGELTEGTFWTGNGPMKIVAKLEMFPHRNCVLTTLPCV